MLESVNLGSFPILLYALSTGSRMDEGSDVVNLLFE